MLVHEDLPPGKFYVNPKFSVNLDDRLNLSDYAANSKKYRNKKSTSF